jgi:hypothetical protein
LFHEKDAHAPGGRRAGSNRGHFGNVDLSECLRISDGPALWGYCRVLGIAASIGTSAKVRILCDSVHHFKSIELWTLRTVKLLGERSLDRRIISFITDRADIYDRTLRHIQARRHAGYPVCLFVLSENMRTPPGSRAWGRLDNAQQGE